LAGDAELKDEVVDELLGAGLVESAFGDVALDVDVEEGTHPPEGHGRPVGFLDRAEVGEVQPLDSLTGVRGRAADAEAVLLGHPLEVLQGMLLQVQLLKLPDLALGD